MPVAEVQLQHWPVPDDGIHALKGCDSCLRRAGAKLQLQHLHIPAQSIHALTGCDAVQVRLLQGLLPSDTRASKASFSSCTEIH